MKDDAWPSKPPKHHDCKLSAAEMAELTVAHWAAQLGVEIVKEGSSITDNPIKSLPLGTPPLDGVLIPIPSHSPLRLAISMDLMWPSLIWPTEETIHGTSVYRE